MLKKSTQFPFHSPTWFEITLLKILQKSTQDFLTHLFIFFLRWLSFILTVEKNSLKHDTCKRCHSVQKEIKNTWSWLYHPLHSKETNIDVKTRVLIRTPGQAENFSLSPRVSMLQNTHLCFPMFHSLKSSWSQCNINCEAIGRSHGVCLMQHWEGSSSLGAQFCASCTCTETQTGWRWWPRTRPLRWWRTFLKKNRYQVNWERALECHLSVGSIEGLTPNYTTLFLHNFKFLSSTLSTTFWWGKYLSNPRCFRAIGNGKKSIKQAIK